MTLEEIFQTNPELLKTPEVQKLIEYTQDQHGRMFGAYKSLNEFHSKVSDLCFHSDQFLIKGMESKLVLRQIIDLI